ncbi:hypothetical protein BDA96_10G124900 [Sorghum bicolor]|uniref:Uncharacterized protein n=1 Tax=Sorghum bicolor TaxID=4558 RepID=A0A921U0P5_SORBI|nr:hypothetical protein BDA96_10G124900 [Sorghum bicolor]
MLQSSPDSRRFTPDTFLLASHPPISASSAAIVAPSDSTRTHAAATHRLYPSTTHSWPPLPPPWRNSSASRSYSAAPTPLDALPQALVPHPPRPHRRTGQERSASSGIPHAGQRARLRIRHGKVQIQ